MIIGGLLRLKTKEEIDILRQESDEEEYVKLKICLSSHDEYRMLASFVQTFLKKFGIRELKFSGPGESSQYLTIEFTDFQDKNEIINLINSLGFWACLDGDDGVIDLADVDLNILKLVFPSQSFSFTTESISQKVFESVTPQHFDLETNKQPQMVDLEIPKEKRERKKREKKQKPVEEVVSIPVGEPSEAVIPATNGRKVLLLEELIKTDISLPISFVGKDKPKGFFPFFNSECFLHKRPLSLTIGSKEIFDIRKEGVRQSFADAMIQEHRRELCRTVEDVEYWDDSRATNVNAVWFTLETIQKPVIWVAGGADKGNDYEPILELVRKKVISLILLGRDTLRMGSVFQGVVPEIIRVASMVQAVQVAHYKAKPGNAVVLSPGCASFDLFENYEDRGRQFKQAVWTL